MNTSRNRKGMASIWFINSNGDKVIAEVSAGRRHVIKMGD